MSEIGCPSSSIHRHGQSRRTLQEVRYSVSPLRWNTVSNSSPPGTVSVGSANSTDLLPAVVVDWVIQSMRVSVSLETFPTTQLCGVSTSSCNRKPAVMSSDSANLSANRSISVEPKVVGGQRHPYGVLLSLPTIGRMKSLLRHWTDRAVIIALLGI